MQFSPFSCHLNTLWHEYAPPPLMSETKFIQNNHPIRRSCVFFVTSLFFTVKGCYPHSQSPSSRTTSYHLSVTSYSIYLQLPSIAGGNPSIRNLRTRNAVVTGTHLTWLHKLNSVQYIFLLLLGMDHRENIVFHFLYCYKCDYRLSENQGLRGMNEWRLERKKERKKEQGKERLMPFPLGYTDFLPFKQNHVYSIVAFTQNISKDASGVATPYLISWKQQVEALDHVPHLRRQLCIELPITKRWH
jgi:hypothetical protein